MKKINIIPALILMVIFNVAAAAQEEKEANIKNPFGVLEFLNWDHDWNSHKYSSKADLDKALQEMKEAGVGWVRVDFLWADIEPRKGEFVFDKYDLIVELADKHGINILGLLNYSADWASSCGRWNCLPRDNREFVDYAAKTASRYKGRVKYWEVWNEPDSSVYWTPQDGLKSYCILLKEVYVALKRVDPECKVLNGGLANGLASVNQLYDNGAKDYFDILNIHFFDTPLREDAIKAVTCYPKLAYKVMSRNSDADKKIWITEIGCPGVKEGELIKNWWLGDNPSEEKQAEWLKQVYSELLKDPNVEKVFWAFFRDCKGHWDNGVDYFGLVRWDFSRKPSYFSYKELGTVINKDQLEQDASK